MQKRVILDRPPVAPVERVVANEIDRAGDIAPAAARHYQEHAVGEGLADPVEEIAGEVGAPPLSRARLNVKLEKRVPMLGSNRGARQRFDRDPVVQGVAPLASDHLALAGGQRGEKVVEIRVALAEEMELLAGAD